MDKQMVSTRLGVATDPTSTACPLVADSLQQKLRSSVNVTNSDKTSEATVVKSALVGEATSAVAANLRHTDSSALRYSAVKSINDDKLTRTGPLQTKDATIAQHPMTAQPCSSLSVPNNSTSRKAFVHKSASTRTANATNPYRAVSTASPFSSDSSRPSASLSAQSPYKNSTSINSKLSSVDKSGSARSVKIGSTTPSSSTTEASSESPFGMHPSSPSGSSPYFSSNVGASNKSSIDKPDSARIGEPKTPNHTADLSSPVKTSSTSPSHSMAQYPYSASDAAASGESPNTVFQPSLQSGATDSRTPKRTASPANRFSLDSFSSSDSSVRHYNSHKKQLGLTKKKSRAKRSTNSSDETPPKKSANEPSAGVLASSSDDDSFACFNEQELAEIDRRVQQQAEARGAAATSGEGSRLFDSPSLSNTPTKDTKQHDSPRSQDMRKTGDNSRPSGHVNHFTRSVQAEAPSSNPIAEQAPHASPYPAGHEQNEAPNQLRQHTCPDVADDEFDQAFGFDFEPEQPSPSLQVVSASRENAATSERALRDFDRGRVDMDSSIATDGLDTARTETRIDDEQPRVQKKCIELEERTPEIHPSFYQPQTYVPKQPPIVHEYSTANRPPNARKCLPVSKVFERPVNSLWRAKFTEFNTMQSELAQMIAYSDDNTVVSAPTGAGKTAIFEMAMARFFAVDLQTQSQRGTGAPQITKRRKIVYVSPSKALCEERLEDWSKRLMDMNLGIEVALVTGDGDPSAAFRDVASSHLILTTPEKWDSLTRKWTESFYLFATIKLFLIDEVHLIADDSRGCCLESIFCRMQAIQRATQNVKVTTQDIQVSR